MVINRSLKKLEELLLTELESSFFWLPVLIAIGIIIFFALPFDPGLYIAILFLFSTTAIAFVLRKKQFAFLLSIALMALMSGFFAATLRTQFVSTPILASQINNGTVAR